MKTLCTFTILLFSFSIWAQTPSFDSYTTGDIEDFTSTEHQAGLLLAGGATDNDAGMTWFLERAGGGDVLVIRASGSDGYNEYLFSELGVNVNSVETIVFNNASAANDPYVLQQIANAELLFIAGGDQYDYYQYWKDTPVEDAINALINEKQITVGGTSAGMAILANCYYTPSGSSAQSNVVLDNPYSASLDIIGKDDFLQVPFMENVITDTHYDQRERAGRHFTFMARVAAAYNVRSRGIAANEYTAIAIDESGLARAFGDYPEFEEDLVYFLQANCDEEFLPEVLMESEPLTWTRGGVAVKAYRLPATPEGEFTFDLNDWQTGTGGIWQNWTADTGNFDRITADDSCNGVYSSTSLIPDNPQITLTPNPVSNILRVEMSTFLPSETSIKVFDNRGVFYQEIPFTAEANEVSFSVKNLSVGFYILKISNSKQRINQKFIVVK